MPPTLLRGQQRRVVVDRQPRFELGLNLRADESQLRPTEVRRAENARLTEFGGVTKRGGLQRVHSTALDSDPITGGFSWVQDGGTVQQLAVCGGKLYTGTYSVGMSWTDRGGTFSTTVTPSFAAFTDGTDDCVYIADGSSLQKWNGTSL